MLPPPPFIGCVQSLLFAGDELDQRVQFILRRGDTAKRPGCFRRSIGFLPLFICIVVIGCFVSKALSVLPNGAH